MILPGYAEVRLRENISKIIVEDTQTGKAVIMYEYDEYTFCLKNYDGLKADIENNLSDWLTTGRSLEVNGQASKARDSSSYNDGLSGVAAFDIDDLRLTIEE